MAPTVDPLAPFVTAYADTMADLAVATTGRMRRGPRGTVLAISGAPVASLNAVVSPSRQPDVGEIVELASQEDLSDVPWSIHVRGDPEPSLVEAAAGLGLTAAERQPLMVRDRDAGRPGERADDGLRVRAVVPDELDLYARTVAAGFGAPPEVLAVLAEPALAEVDGLTFFLAEVDGVPVGTGMTATSGELTGIYNVTTLPAARRRGHGRAVTLELVRAAFAAGAGTCYLYASEMGEPVYRSLDFRTEEHLTVMTAG